MKLKKGVILAGLKIEMRPVMKAANILWRDHGKELVITSGLDGTHSAGSYHYYGYALDLRTRYFKAQKEKEQVAEQLQSILLPKSNAYQVILEKTHIHVEFDYDMWINLERKTSRSHLL